MIRKPIVAGQFYEGDFSELDKQIKECFNHEKGPGLPVFKRKNKLKGVVVPHAGYFFSGPCAAWSYKEVAEAEFPDLYILLGPSHSGFDSCISLYDWETPFGIVKTDKDFGNNLIKIGLEQNEEAHATEHSIEVQLPFLQFVSKDKLKNLRILPIIISRPDWNELAPKIISVIKKENKKVIFICSSDFTHYGINYSYIPFSENIKENLYKLDAGAIEHIKKLDSYRFLDYIEQKQATICGYLPIALLLELCKLMNAKKAELLQYYCSGDIVNDYSNSVGYTAIKIK